MALPSTRPLSLSQVRTELGLTGSFSMGSTAARNLAGKPSGQISLSDFLGKSAVDYSINPISLDNVSVYTTSYGGSSSSPNYKDGTVHTITGITGTCTLRFTGTAPIDDGSIFVYVRKNGGAWQTVFNALQGNAPNVNNITMTVDNGDTIQFRSGVGGSLSTGPFDSPRMSSRSGTMSVINTSDGNAVVGSYSIDGSFIDYYPNDDGGGGPIIRP